MIELRLEDKEAAELYESESRKWHRGPMMKLIEQLGRALQGQGDRRVLDDDDRLGIAAVNLAEAQGRIRKLEEQLEIRRDMYDGSQQQLKIMTEDRDEYRQRWVDANGDIKKREVGMPGWIWVGDADCQPSKAELNLTRMFYAKLMGEGRVEHGPLDLATDSRSVEHFIGEAIDEGIDSLAYLLMAMGKLEREKS